MTLANSLAVPAELRLTGRRVSLIGQQTRVHRSLDLAVDARHEPPAVRVLARSATRVVRVVRSKELFGGGTCFGQRVWVAAGGCRHQGSFVEQVGSACYPLSVRNAGLGEEFGEAVAHPCFSRG